MRIDRPEMMTAVLSASIAGSAHAAPIEGAMRSNLAVILLLLGIGALLMGLRNLRDLRHKRLVTNRDTPAADEASPKRRDRVAPD